MTDVLSQSQPSFFKNLAANDKATRDAAVSSLTTYLSARSQISSLEILKLWKGLFYCMWMSDKPRNQQQLARGLASLIHSLQPAVVVPFLFGFWATTAREWVGVDGLRMDKYLYLIRQYCLEAFRWFARRDWKGVEEYLDVLRDVPLNPTEQRIPNGLRYHLIDIYVDELERVWEDLDEESEWPIEKIVEPLTTLAKDSPTKTIRERAKNVLEDERVKNWTGESPAVEEESEKTATKEDQNDEWNGIED